MPSLDAHKVDMLAFGGGNCSGSIDVAATLAAHGTRQDFEVETFVAHTLRGEGFDASEDGTGRGTPIVVCRDVAPSLTSSYAKQQGNSDTSMGPNIVAALAIRGRNGVSQVEMRKDGLANTVLTPSGGRAGIGVGAVLYRAGVRRLTPTECERLQGLPDGHTLIPWRNKSEEKCPDGPRYRACGNAMPRNVMAWLGERIERALIATKEAV